MSDDRVKPRTVYLSDLEVSLLEREAAESGRSGVSAQVRYILGRRRQDGVDSSGDQPTISMSFTYGEIWALYEEFWPNWDRPFRGRTSDGASIPIKLSPGMNPTYDLRDRLQARLREAKSAMQQLVVR